MKIKFCSIVTTADNQRVLQIRCSRLGIWMMSALMLILALSLGGFFIRYRYLLKQEERLLKLEHKQFTENSVPLVPTLATPQLLKVFDPKAKWEPALGSWSLGKNADLPWLSQGNAKGPFLFKPFSHAIGTLDLSQKTFKPQTDLRMAFDDGKKSAPFPSSTKKNVRTELIPLSKTNDESVKLVFSLPNQLPTPGHISSPFGKRYDPFTGRKVMHYGIDIPAPFGAPVVATSDGIVKVAYTNRSFGKFVVLNHGFGINTRYGHLSQILVKKGDKVKRGQIIARVGSSGKATGPHVHYEILRNGVPMNPSEFLEPPADNKV